MHQSNDFREKREIAQSEARDYTGKIIAGALGLGPAYDLITTLVVPLHKKKQKKFIQDLAIRLKKLEDQGQIDFEELAQNEEFNTIITKAILLAQQNHQKEKLEALKNVVQNSAVKITDNDINTDVIEHYLSLVERFSDLHILLLRTFRTPEEIWKGIKDERTSYDMINLRMVFSKIHPELNSRLDFIKLLWKELYNQGLVIKETMQHSVAVDGGIRPLVTEFGEGLLSMIENE